MAIKTVPYLKENIESINRIKNYRSNEIQSHQEKIDTLRDSYNSNTIGLLNQIKGKVIDFPFSDAMQKKMNAFGTKKGTESFTIINPLTKQKGTRYGSGNLGGGQFNVEKSNITGKWQVSKHEYNYWMENDDATWIKCKLNKKNGIDTRLPDVKFDKEVSACITSFNDDINGLQHIDKLAKSKTSNVEKLFEY